jgi:regulator of cell morphogenesis and NO signaling
MRVDASRTVRELAVEVPNATRVFEKLGIDYCCGGGKSLQEACAAARLPVDQVLQSLESEAGAPRTGSAPRETDSLAALIEHILTRHHTYVKAEVPRLEQLIAKVVSVHGENHPELLRVRDTFRGLGQELTMHCMKEEQILFPYIIEMEETASRKGRLHPPMFGTVRNPIHMMVMEHDSAGGALHTIREVTGGFTAPADACISYQTLYKALAEFEADLHQHIHLENNILFPRAVQMEAAA